METGRFDHQGMPIEERRFIPSALSDEKSPPEPYDGLIKPSCFDGARHYSSRERNDEQSRISPEKDNIRRNFPKFPADPNPIEPSSSDSDSDSHSRGHKCIPQNTKRSGEDHGEPVSSTSFKLAIQFLSRSEKNGLDHATKGTQPMNMCAIART